MSVNLGGFELSGGRAAGCRCRASGKCGRAMDAAFSLNDVMAGPAGRREVGFRIVASFPPRHDVVNDQLIRRSTTGACAAVALDDPIPDVAPRLAPASTAGIEGMLRLKLAPIFGRAGIRAGLAQRDLRFDPLELCATLDACQSLTRDVRAAIARLATKTARVLKGFRQIVAKDLSASITGALCLPYGGLNAG